MVFAHGFGCDQNMWRFVAPAFAADFKIVLFDHVGAGGSDLSAFSPEKYSRLEGYADDVVEIGRSLNLKDAMEAGQIDLAIGLLPQLKAGFFQRRLFEQKYVCLFRHGHKLDQKRLRAADFFAADHVAIVSAGTGHGQVDEILDNHTPQRRVKLKVPHFVAIGHILQSTDLIATVPERLAERMVEPFGLRHLPHPVDLPRIAINQFWHAKHHKDPANQWLRNLLVDLHADRAPA